METVNLADAKTRLSELVERAASGESVCITRRGRAVARITTIEGSRKRIDASVLRAITEQMPMQSETAGDFMRRTRDEERY